MKDKKVKEKSWGVEIVIEWSGYENDIEKEMVIIKKGRNMWIFGLK
jgi:hypothetical protein